MTKKSDKEELKKKKEEEEKLKKDAEEAEKKLKKDAEEDFTSIIFFVNNDQNDPYDLTNPNNHDDPNDPNDPDECEKCGNIMNNDKCDICDKDDCNDCFDDYIKDRNKRKRQGPPTMDSFFKQIIENINKKQKKQKTQPSYIDDFKNYFIESDVLLPINKNIKNLKDLIELGKTYDPKDKNRYVINLRALNKSVKPLEELDAMIGMKNVKEMIIDLIFFRLQNIQDSRENTEELWHLVIQGTPGSGKTEVAKIIGKLYYSLGIVKKDKFTLVRRSDLIGKYLGHTAKMTQEVFDNAKGGILFIDEAYSLGSAEQRDSFSKECIDTINQNLTENRDTVVFIAGYKDSLNESFFSGNQGLSRRFKFRFNIDKYSATDLRSIFIKKIKESNWNILADNFEKEIPIKFFDTNLKTFKFNGGSMESLWHLTKIYHARRIFGKSNDMVKKIIYEDIENGFKAYCDNNDVVKDDDVMTKYIIDTMYS